MKALAKKIIRRFMGRDASVPEPYQPPPHLLQDDFDPIYAESCEEGTFVFLLHYVPKGGGGLADALHLGLEYARQSGRKIFFHATSPQVYSSVVENILWTNHDVSADQVLESIDFTPECICATAWPTVYEALKIPSKRKLYFVQDYEPWFLKAGVSRWYAEQTYTLGFEIFTLGYWLPSQLKAVHDVEAAPMPFPATDTFNPGKPSDQRKTVAVYMQPDKEHRGTELLLTVCRKIAPLIKAKGMKLVLFGAAGNEWINPGCECEMRGVLKEDELKSLIADTRVGVSASFTNISLLPPRFLANGARIVELNLPGITMNLPEDMENCVRFTPPQPGLLAEAIMESVEETTPLPEEKVKQYQADHSWPTFVQQFSSWLNR